MGRKKIQIKFIEDKSARTSTFWKRHKTVLKKAKELAEMCNAQVAVIIISEKNKIHHYPDAEASVDEMIERWNAQEGIKEQIDSEEDIEEEDEEDMGESVEAKEDMQLLLDGKGQLTKEIDELKLRISQMEGKELGNLTVEELMRLWDRIQVSLRLVQQKRRERDYEKLSGDNEQTVEKMRGELQQTIDSHFTNKAGEQNMTNQKEGHDDLVCLRLGLGPIGK